MIKIQVIQGFILGLQKEDTPLSGLISGELERNTLSIGKKSIQDFLKQELKKLIFKNQ